MKVSAFRRSLPILTLITLVALAACSPAPKSEAPPETAAAPATAPAPAQTQAHANLQAREGGTVVGAVTFREENSGVTIIAHVEGAPPGLHGFHVHEVGDCSAEDFTSAGGHFNPTGVEHGAPDAEVHHAGDLGNIEIGEDGSAHFEATSTMLTVSDGPNSVVGRAVILHEGQDDLTSQPTGAAGSRLACGVIEAH
jgi:Cu-Zn family superoxide dismutase